MIDCIVTKPFEHSGRRTQVGAPLTLHPKQAESLRLQGKVKFAPVAPIKGKKTEAKGGKS